MEPKKSSECKPCRTVEITEEQDERLRKLSERTRVPVAHYVREGIALVLGHAERQQRMVEIANQQEQEDARRQETES